MPKIITNQCGGVCQLCPRILAPELQPGVERPFTGDEVVCYEPPNCNTSGIIYRITCSCGLHYMGKTRKVRGLNGRFYGHAADLRVDAIDSVLHAHLQSCPTWRVCIVYQIPPAVKSEEQDDPLRKEWYEKGDNFLAQAEHLLMRRWRTVFPYGLNDDMFGKSTKNMFRQVHLQDGPIIFTALVDPHRSFIAKHLGCGDGYSLDRFPPRPLPGPNPSSSPSSPPLVLPPATASSVRPISSSSVSSSASSASSSDLSPLEEGQKQCSSGKHVHEQ